MSEGIAIALLSLIGTLAGSFAGILTAGKLTNYRIEQLEKKVEKHNSIVERTYRLEEEAEVDKERFKVINNRLRDLEEIHKPDRRNQ